MLLPFYIWKICGFSHDKLHVKSVVAYLKGWIVSCKSDTIPPSNDSLLICYLSFPCFWFFYCSHVFDKSTCRSWHVISSILLHFSERFSFFWPSLNLWPAYSHILSSPVRKQPFYVAQFFYLKEYISSSSDWSTVFSVIAFFVFRIPSCSLDTSFLCI
jgi:hypothetical protein